MRIRVGDAARHGHGLIVPRRAAEIKGWPKIEEVLQADEIPKDQFHAQFKIPEGFPVSSQLKDIEAAAPGFSVTALRDWITASRAAGHQDSWPRPWG